jgi:hypothetical protein
MIEAGVSSFRTYSIERSLPNLVMYARESASKGKTWYAKCKFIQRCEKWQYALTGSPNFCATAIVWAAYGPRRSFGSPPVNVLRAREVTRIGLQPALYVSDTKCQYK